MRKNTLTTAVLAGLTGAAGLVNVASAVNVNPDGLGQVLLYPYYTVREGNDTLISVVNTTSDAKAVKVRFLEAQNSTEVLDFNLYLSEFDVWTAAITLDGDTGGGKMITADTSCTVPYFFGNREEGADTGEQAFLEFAIAEDGGPDDLSRTGSGYVEMIEMGTLVDGDPGTEEAPGTGRGSATAVTHVNGVPADCQQLVDAWTQVVSGPSDIDNYWLGGDANIDIEAPSGGLFGAGAIIDIDQGLMFSYNATAIDNFRTSEIHTDPGNLNPSLNDANVRSSSVFVSDNQTAVSSDWGAGIFAVNGALTIDTLLNEYNINPELGALSEWVVTFPTKRAHTQTDVDEDGETLDDPIPPFTSLWTGNGACETAFVRVWDREEGPDFETPTETRPPGPSPRPGDPVVDPEPPFQLCWEANVIRFTNLEEDTPDATEILGARLDNGTTAQGYVNIDTGGPTSGWVRFSFNDPDPTEIPIHEATSDDGDVHFGLPAIGFWVNTFSNEVLDNTNRNFGGSFQHRGTRRITGN